MINCGDPGDEPPRWEEQANSPDIEAWAARIGYSPFAPWEYQCLVNANGSPQSSAYIGSSSNDLFNEFQKKLLAEKLPVACLPSQEEIRVLIDLAVQRKAAKKDIIDQVQFLGLRNPLIILVVDKIKTPLSLLINKTLQEADRPLFFAKMRYNRARAYQLIPDLAPDFLPAGFFPMHPSFPSGHSTQAHLVVNVLAAVFGDDRVGNARDMAWQIGRNREIAGLHYPSDTRAGYYLAAVLIQDALRSTAFRADCVNARNDYDG